MSWIDNLWDLKRALNGEEIHPGSVDAGDLMGTVQVSDGDSIQDAVDAAEWVRAPVEIRVRPDWDPSVESFPIKVETGDSPTAIRGPGNVARDPRKHDSSGAFDLGGVDAHAFDFVGEEADGTTHNWAPNATLERFGVTGAEGLVSIKDVDSAVFRDLYAFDTTGVAYEIQEDAQSAIWNYFENCHALSGQIGFKSEGGAKANACTFMHCVSRDNDGIGLEWVSGAGSTWFGGTLERNGQYNADIQSPAFTIFGTYFEPGETSTADIIYRGTVSDGGRLIGARFHGREHTPERAVLVNPADGIRADWNSFQNYTGGFMQVSSGADNVIGRHNFARDETPVLRSDSGTRTRFGSVIGGGPLDGVDLSGVDGQYPGDRAIADGSSVAADGALARWGGAGWQYHDPTGTV